MPWTGVIKASKIVKYLLILKACLKRFCLSKILSDKELSFTNQKGQKCYVKFHSIIVV